MGNCKTCIKPKTSDGPDRPGRQSISEQQGPSACAEGGLDLAESSTGRVPSTGSLRSRIGSSKSAKRVSSTANQPLHPLQNHQEVPSPLNQDVGSDAYPRSSSATRRRKPESGSTTINKGPVVISVRPAGEESDVYADEGRSMMNQLKTQYPVDNFKHICFILWQKDERLVHNRHYKFSRNNGLQIYLTESFYTSHPTFKVFRELLTIYTKEIMNTNRRESIENEFLDKVMEKEVMQICWAFLNHAGYFVSDRSTFKNALRHIWFPRAFQHIFAGFEDGDRISGLHNWLQFSLEKENIEYRGCKKQIPEILVHIKFQWKGVLKENGSMFVGTSPEFELALYTLLFFQTLSKGTKSLKEETYELNLGGQRINDEPNVLVQVVVDTCNSRKFPVIDRILKTAYPIKKQQRS